MSFGDIYRRDRVTYQRTTRHPVSREMIPDGPPVVAKAYVEWYNTLRASESGVNPKQLAMIFVSKNEPIKQGDMVTKIEFENGETIEESFKVQMVSPQGGFSMSHKEVWL